MSLLFFRGKGLHTNVAEKKQWNRRVNVVLQLKAWCDEAIMKRWIEEDWNYIFTIRQLLDCLVKQTFQQTSDVKL